MRGTLGLTLYRLAARRKPQPQGPVPARPRGRLAWLHSPSAESRPTMLELARHLIEDDGLSVLLTTSEPAGHQTGEQTYPPTEAIAAPPPAEHGEEIRGFLDHWQPEIAVMAEGELRPLLIEELVRARHSPAAGRRHLAPLRAGNLRLVSRRGRPRARRLRPGSGPRRGGTAQLPQGRRARRPAAPDRADGTGFGRIALCRN